MRGQPPEHLPRGETETSQSTIVPAMGSEGKVVDALRLFRSLPDLADSQGTAPCALHGLFKTAAY